MTNPTYLALTARRSANARALAPPGPDEATLALIAEAAAAAPDHGHIAPFRFIAFDDAGRARFGDALADAAAHAPGAGDAEREKARSKAMQGAAILALASRFQPDHVKVGMADQWLTLGGALQNLVLAAESFGFGVAIRSGAIFATPQAARACELQPGEELVAVVAIGTKTETLPPRRKPVLADVFRTLRG